MAKKRQRSLLRMQQEKLRKQRALTRTKTSTPVSQRVEKVKVKVEPQKQLQGKSSPKALPPGKKGGPIKTTKGPRRTNVTKSPAPKARVGKPGTGGVKPQLRLPPGGKTAANLMKNSAVARSAGSKLGGIGLIASGIATAQDLTASLKRGEGYASLPKLAKAIAKGKPKKTTGGKTNRRGRVTSKPKPTAKKSSTPDTSAARSLRAGRTPDTKPSAAQSLKAGRTPDRAPTSSKPSKSAAPKSTPKASAPKSSPKKAPAKKAPVKAPPKVSAPKESNPTKASAPKTTPKKTVKKAEKTMSRNKRNLLRRQGRL